MVRVEEERWEATTARREDASGDRWKAQKLVSVGCGRRGWLCYCIKMSQWLKAYKEDFDGNLMTIGENGWRSEVVTRFWEKCVDNAESAE